MYEMNKQEIFYDNADGQGIIINSLNGCYYSLNLISTGVFELLCAGYSPEAIAEALLGLKGCPGEHAAGNGGFCPKPSAGRGINAVGPWVCR